MASTVYTYKDLVRYTHKFNYNFDRIKEILNDPDDNNIPNEYLKYWTKIRKSYDVALTLAKAGRALHREVLAARAEYKELLEALKKIKSEIKTAQKNAAKQYDFAYFSPDEVENVKYYIREQQQDLADKKIALQRKEESLVKKKEKCDKLEVEYIIKQDELETAIQDTNLAINSYYRLSDAEMELFTNQRERILKGIEKWGNISLAIKNDPGITMKASSIMHYAAKHNQFKQDLEIAKQVFKENFDAEILDRAINGTKNPVFQRGEYIGEYAVKDNKLLVEVAKAKLPETYNPKVVADRNAGTGSGGTTINILSFDGADETKRGYARNIGVVTSVDDTGRVKRITQAKEDDLEKAEKAMEVKKMIDFYKKKGGAEIIEGEVVDGSDGTEDASGYELIG